MTLGSRLPVYYCARPEDDAEEATSLTFRVADGWWAIDQDQLIMPIVALQQDGQQVGGPNGERAILKQYGGAELRIRLMEQAMTVADEFDGAFSDDSSPLVGFEFEIRQAPGDRRGVHALDEDHDLVDTDE